MKLIYKFRIIILFIAGSALGCKKFVQIGPPQTELVTANVFDNNGSATAAQTGIYTQMFSVSSNIALINGLLSDELTNYAASYQPVYINQMTAMDSWGLWSNAYNFIYQENAILAALTNNHTLSPAIVQQLTGEALFIRAFWHFYLTNCYGDVPIVTTTDYTVNNLIHRSPREMVMQQIVTDLQKAAGLLNVNFVNADDTSTSAQTERVRPTSWAAVALLARAYLYQGNWNGADSAASVVIRNTSMFGLTALDSAFLKNSREAIWQLQTPTPVSLNISTDDGYYFILTAAPSYVALSPQLLNVFEQGDARYSHWVDSISFSGVTYYFPYKYKSTTTNYSGAVKEYTMVLRLGEQYLIRAEAETQLNHLTNAASDLNTIRARAAVGATMASTQSELLTAVLHERQVELFTEWGNRWFDLIRMGAVDTVMGSPGNVTQYKKGSWVPTDTLYPIPQSEININPNLSQNVGY